MVEQRRLEPGDILPEVREQIDVLVAPVPLLVLDPSTQRTKYAWRQLGKGGVG